jgi:hypothetical protein
MNHFTVVAAGLHAYMAMLLQHNNLPGGKGTDQFSGQRQTDNASADNTDINAVDG